ncbi:WD repeat-containing protein 76-like isoform X1 [Huso huso]|uniref:WD repeat-containing protein 76 n=1 Tax=Huso huso TaxID=61971 RepID=A0ABR0YWX0_HUSHU
MPIDKAERRYDVKDSFVKLQKIQVQTPLQKQAIGNMRRRSVRIACRPPRQLVTDSTNESSDSEAHVQSKKRRLLAAGARARGQLRNVSPKAGCSPESDPQNQTLYSSLKSRTRAACPEKASITVKVPSGSDSESHSSEDDGSLGPGGLSAYELKRLKNIQQNKAFFSFLNIQETTDALRAFSRKSKPQTQGLKRPQQTPVNAVATRKSLCLQRLDPVEAPVPEQQDFEEEKTLNQSGPIKMVPVNLGPNGRLPQSFLDCWNEPYKCANITQKVNLNGYKSSLIGMTLQEDHVAKVVKNNIFSVAVHPCTSTVLVAAGDKWGRVGLWDVNSDYGDDGVYLFEPHSRPVSCMYFSASHPAHLLTLSYDGTIRCADVNKAVFDDVYQREEGLSCFDFLSKDCSTLIAGGCNGNVMVVDRRAQSMSHELLTELDIMVIRTVHVHPVDNNYFMVAGKGSVCIYDARCLKPKGSRSVASLQGHTKTVNSAYFSPLSGNRVLTTCMDDRLRVYDSTRFCLDVPLLASIRHNNNTGRWLTKFRAVWNPTLEDCFVVGSMAQPRQIEMFHESGSLLHTFRGDCLGSVCSINAFHPSRSVLVAGNSSGRLHVFMG